MHPRRPWARLQRQGGDRGLHHFGPGSASLQARRAQACGACVRAAKLTQAHSHMAPAISRTCAHRPPSKGTIVARRHINYPHQVNLAQAAIEHRARQAGKPPGQAQPTTEDKGQQPQADPTGDRGSGGPTGIAQQQKGPRGTVPFPRCKVLKGAQHSDAHTMVRSSTVHRTCTPAPAAAPGSSLGSQLAKKKGIYSAQQCSTSIACSMGVPSCTVQVSGRPQ
jgi:hypothetical protein